ncbi:MAG: hypothetical protein ACLPPL_02150 [Desulfobaccales bacterium]
MIRKSPENFYKERWRIEIFFRFTKLNMKIKAFIVNSECIMFIG